MAIISKRVANETNDDLCNVYFIQYVKLLKDQHSCIELNLHQVINFSSQAVIDSFKSTARYRGFKKREIDTTRVKDTYQLGPDIKVAFVGNGKDHLEGIVINKSSLLDVGHVLLTLDKGHDSSYSCMYNVGLSGFNFNTAYSDDIYFVKGNLPHLGLYKNGKPGLTDQCTFIILDNTTYYLAVHTFEVDLSKLYLEYLPEIRKRPFLILDIRNNGGGDEANYFPLLPLLYTKPLELDQMAIWVSPDNIKSYEEREKPDQQLIQKLKAARLYSFLNLHSDGTWAMEGSEFPQR